MKKNSGFEKFANKKKSGTIKEEYRKERREVKTERAEGIKERIREKRNAGKPKPETPTAKPTRAVIAKKGAPANVVKPVAGTGHQPASAGVMPLNKYIAHCGVCARRDACLLYTSPSPRDA